MKQKDRNIIAGMGGGMMPNANWIAGAVTGSVGLAQFMGGL